MLLSHGFWWNFWKLRKSKSKGWGLVEWEQRNERMQFLYRDDILGRVIKRKDFPWWPMCVCLCVFSKFDHVTWICLEIMRLFGTGHSHCQLAQTGNQLSVSSWPTSPLDLVQVWNPFGSYVPLCNNPLPLPCPLSAKWCEHKHAPSLTNTHTHTHTQVIAWRIHV